MSEKFVLDDETKRKLQLKLLDMIKYIDKLCSENGIEYYLMYGSLLGSIRHKGFIPWDDDLDIGMTLDNYLKFINVCNERLDKDKYFLQTMDTEKNYYLSFAKIRDLNTTLVEEVNENLDVHRCVAVDVFPIVGYPNKSYQRKLFKISRAFMLSANINIINNKFLRTISKIIIKVIGKKNVLKISTNYCMKFDISKCEYLCSCFTGGNINKNVFKKEWFGKPVYREFEDIKLPTPSNSDKVLRTIYDDYMILPKEEERKSGGHSIVYLNLDENIYK